MLLKNLGPIGLYHLIFLGLQIAALPVNSSEPSLAWVSPNARIPFPSYEEGCAYSIANYCSFVPGSGCISVSPGAVEFFENNGRPYATCGGSASFEYLDGGIKKIRIFSSPTLDAVYSAPIGYVLTDPPTEPGPQQCAGNPIDIGGGSKIQLEEDVNAKQEGQLSFRREYSSKLFVLPAWRHNYQNSIQLLAPLDPSSYRFKSAPYSDKGTACVSGWMSIRNNINDGWVNRAVAIHQGDVCKILVDGKVVKNLGILKNVFVSSPAAAEAVNLVRFNGVVQTYVELNGSWRSLEGRSGILRKVAYGDIAWRYTAPNGDIEDYNADGKLLSITASNGMKQELFYDATTGQLGRVKDSANRELVFAYTGNQISSLTVDGNKTTSYAYNSLGLITTVTRPDNTTRIYHYEDSRFPTALTGITDERGKRYATWAYDAQGRAISSEHAGGADKTLLTFNADGSTTVTNALNKKTIYRFDDIAGARRVVKVEGQPTANCAGANQDYTYTAEGWVASKTDWKGIKTIYQYNTIGQETSRTEAYGTAEARTITTEWHPTLYLKTKVTEPTQETTFNYDANGRLLNQSVRALTN